MWKQIACIVATNQSQLVTYRLQSHIRQKHPVDKKTVDEISKEKTEGVSQKNMEGKVKTVSDDNTIKRKERKIGRQTSWVFRMYQVWLQDNRKRSVEGPLCGSTYEAKECK